MLYCWSKCCVASVDLRELNKRNGLAIFKWTRKSVCVTFLASLEFRSRLMSVRAIKWFVNGPPALCTRILQCIHNVLYKLVRVSLSLSFSPFPRLDVTLTNLSNSKFPINWKNLWVQPTIPFQLSSVHYGKIENKEGSNWKSLALIAFLRSLSTKYLQLYGAKTKILQPLALMFEQHLQGNLSFRVIT